MRLGADFFARDARIVAAALIGKRLVHELDGRRRWGRIVETEAYLGPEDLASHARFGAEGRARLMFGPAGIAYVYLIYGMHDCFNVVTGEAGAASAVLVRALEPGEGVARSDGPGRLTRALGIDRRYNGAQLCTGPLWIEDPRDPAPRVRSTARIGVGYAGRWAKRRLRYLDADSEALSVRLRGPTRRVT